MSRLQVAYQQIPHATTPQAVTTGAGCFAEGLRLSAKPLRPSAKPLPSAVLGKALSAKIWSAKASLPRAVYRALGKAFAESPTLGKARNKKIRKKTWKKILIGGGAHWQVAAFFRAKFAATRSAGFELVTSPSRDTSSATCTTHSHASICRFGYPNIILNQMKIDCLRA
jgi:hypothetical protein